MIHHGGHAEITLIADTLGVCSACAVGFDLPYSITAGEESDSVGVLLVHTFGEKHGRITRVE